jgi:hypothetical protein
MTAQNARCHFHRREKSFAKPCSERVRQETFLAEFLLSDVEGLEMTTSVGLG